MLEMKLKVFGDGVRRVVLVARHFPEEEGG